MSRIITATFVLLFAASGAVRAEPTIAAATPDETPAQASPAVESGPVAFDFALIGDFPYTEEDLERMPALLADLGAAPGLAFLVHLGDIHGKLESPGCSDLLYQSRIDGLVGTGLPWVITPGDNDWTDCDGSEGTTLERLAAFRRMFHPNPGRSWGPGGFALRHQGDIPGYEPFIENAIWERDGVVFATLHMVQPAMRAVRQGDAEGEAYKAVLRDAARAWLGVAFDHAEAIDARGVFLATQASLWPNSARPDFNYYVNPGIAEPSEFMAPFVADLLDRTRRFRRPVVLANGDTHYFRIDKPLADEARAMLENFTRVEGFGSPHGHWVWVRVEPERAEVFSFRQEIVEDNRFTLTPPDQRPPRVETGWEGLMRAVRAVRLATPALALVGASTLFAGTLVVLRWIWRAVRGRL